MLRRAHACSQEGEQKKTIEERVDIHRKFGVWIEGSTTNKSTFKGTIKKTSDLPGFLKKLGDDKLSNFTISAHHNGVKVWGTGDGPLPTKNLIELFTPNTVANDANLVFEMCHCGQLGERLLENLAGTGASITFTEGTNFNIPGTSLRLDYTDINDYAKNNRVTVRASGGSQ